MMHTHRPALFWYLAALAVFAVGVLMAAASYPGGYDWVYTVVSALASQKRNPQGSYWFAAALCLSMVLLWCYVAALKKSWHHASRVERAFLHLLHVAVCAGFLVGLDRLFFYDISALVDKLHEIIALIAFVAFYAGTLGLLLRLMQQQRVYLILLLAVAMPIMVLGVVEFGLYLAQRDIGWVAIDWRDREISPWLSFALWQWLEVLFLWLGLGVIAQLAGRGGPTHHGRAD